MKQDNQWLLMTYYCPTHGSVDRCQPIELTKKDLAKARLKINTRKI